jgi:hypothetical protein
MGRAVDNVAGFGPDKKLFLYGPLHFRARAAKQHAQNPLIWGSGPNIPQI